MLNCRMISVKTRELGKILREVLPMKQSGHILSGPLSRRGPRSLYEGDDQR